MNTRMNKEVTAEGNILETESFDGNVKVGLLLIHTIKVIKLSNKM